MIEVEIDGKTLEAKSGAMIIEVADEAGIPIPRFCYHKKLPIAANCRMCLVDVEKVGKPMPACATPVTAGMKISTCSSKARSAQQAVMEFLLINHPLDCPICDQGGECELQDVSLGYGRSHSVFEEGKRAVEDKDIGPLVATDLTRCIQCTRCVRFGQEIVGLPELGAVGRGELMKISTYVEHSLVSEMAGNIIDLCPVGALTSKPFRFTARAWELQQHPSIAPHDAMGSHIYVHTRSQQVMRVVPRENPAVNEVWISDRDRYSYLGLKSDDRVTQPQIKQNGEWITVDWPTALQVAADGLLRVLQTFGADQMGALASASATLEEFYLLQKLMRGMGSHHIDHRTHQTDTRDQHLLACFPQLGFEISELATRDSIFLIGSHIRHEQPIAAHGIRKASLEGAVISVLNPIRFDFHFNVQASIIVHPDAMVHRLAGVAKALMPNDAPEASLFSAIVPSEIETRIAQQLKQSQRGTILLGALAANHPDAASLRMLAHLIARWSQVSVGYLTEGANSAGAWLAGVVPHRGPAGIQIETPGSAANHMFNTPLKAYVLLGIEPERDCENSAKAQQALDAAEHVVLMASFVSDAAREYADVILPMAAFSETSGTFVNAAGTWQSFSAAVSAPFETQPGWKILRLLGHLLALPDFEYHASTEIRDELRALVDSAEERDVEIDASLIMFKAESFSPMRIGYWPMYASDALVRRASALQASGSHEATGLRINTYFAQQLQLQARGFARVYQEHSVSVRLPVLIDERVPDQCVLIPAGVSETIGLGAAMGVINIEACV